MLRTIRAATNQVGSGIIIRSASSPLSSGIPYTSGPSTFKQNDHHYSTLKSISYLTRETNTTIIRTFSTTFIPPTARNKPIVSTKVNDFDDDEEDHDGVIDIFKVFEEREELYLKKMTPSEMKQYFRNQFTVPRSNKTFEFLEDKLAESISKDPVFRMGQTSLSTLIQFLKEMKCQNTSVWTTVVDYACRMRYENLLVSMFDHLYDSKILNEEMAGKLLHGCSRFLPSKPIVASMIEKVTQSYPDLSPLIIRAMLNMIKNDGAEKTKAFWDLHKDKINKFHSDIIYCGLVDNFSRAGDFETATKIIKQFNREGVHKGCSIILGHMYSSNQMALYKDFMKQAKILYDYVSIHSVSLTRTKIFHDDIQVVKNQYLNFIEHSLSKDYLYGALYKSVIERYLKEKVPWTMMADIINVLKKGVTRKPLFISVLTDILYTLTVAKYQGLGILLKVTFMPHDHLDEIYSISLIDAATSMNRMDLIRKLQQRFLKDCPAMYTDPINFAHLMRAVFIFGTQDDTKNILEHLNPSLTPYTELLALQLAISECMPETRETFKAWRRASHPLYIDMIPVVKLAIEIVLLKGRPDVAQKLFEGFEKRKFVPPLQCYNQFIRYYTITENQPMVDHWTQLYNSLDQSLYANQVVYGEASKSYLWDGIKVRHELRKKYELEREKELQQQKEDYQKIINDINPQQENGNEIPLQLESLVGLIDRARER